MTADPYAAGAAALAKAGAAIVLLILVWAVAIKPHQDLADERQAHAATKARHAKVLAEIAEKTAAVAEKAKAAHALFLQGVEEDAHAHAAEIAAAEERGRAAAAGIADGAVRVRIEWRDRDCPRPAPGEGAEPAARDQAVPRGRADAIGHLLGKGDAWDADYQLCYARLKRAQSLINTCYEEPADAPEAP